jgi:hypothetical protein
LLFVVSYLGFLDGGDRMMALASDQVSPALTGSESGSGGDDLRLSAQILAPAAPTASPNVNACFLSAEIATAALLVTNLPPLLFSQISDLEPLLCPYGAIKRIEFLGSGSELNSKIGPGTNTDANVNRNLELDGKATSTSVIVEYTSLASSQEAKFCLRGQVYAGFGLEVEYVRGYSAGRAGGPGIVPSRVATLPANPNGTSLNFSGSRIKKMIENEDESSDGPFSYMSLNPLAAPFVLDSHSSPQDISSVATNVGAISDDKIHSFNPFFYNQPLDTWSSGLTVDIQARPGARCQYWSRKNGHQLGYQQHEYQNSTQALPNLPIGYDPTSTSSTGAGLKAGFVNLRYVHPSALIVVLV